MTLANIKQDNERPGSSLQKNSPKQHYITSEFLSGSSEYLSSISEMNDLPDKSIEIDSLDRDFESKRTIFPDRRSPNSAIDLGTMTMLPIITPSLQSNLLASNSRENELLKQKDGAFSSLLKELKEDQDEKIDIINQRLRIGLARQELRLKGVDENEINLLLPIPELIALKSTKVEAQNEQPIVSKKATKEAAKISKKSGNEIRKSAIAKDNRSRRSSGRNSNSNPVLSSIINSQSTPLANRSSSGESPQKCSIKRYDSPAASQPVIILSNSNQEILDLIFSGKKQISWSYFIGYLKKIFDPWQDNNPFILKGFESENLDQSDRFLLFYQSDLLKLRFLPNQKCKTSSGNINMDDLLEELQSETLKEALLPFSVSINEMDREALLDSVKCELKRRCPRANLLKPLFECFSEGFYDLIEILLYHELCDAETKRQELNENNEVIGGGKYAIDQLLLHYCKMDDLPLIRKLLVMGANPNASKSSAGGQTPLFYASLRGNYDACLLLIEHDAMLNIPKYDGSTPLNVAAEKNHYEICKLLLNYGADVSLSTKDKWNPFSNAVHNGSLQLTSLFLEHGADINCVLGNGYTPLTVSAVQGDLGIFKFLLKAGADPHVKTKEGKGIFELAEKNRREDILHYLAKHLSKRSSKRSKTSASPDCHSQS